ncbi:MAG TPA: DUF2306 domain-containing protein [Rhizomicrobium sp.]|nr:DUF2306 domain-containing protein [Rhizomicrobium sp.]
MERGIARIGLWTMAVLSVLVALLSLRYYAVPAGLWLGIGPDITGVIKRVPVQALGHMLIAPFALLLGPFQFMPRLRARYPRAHRISGRIYVGACLVSGVSAFATAFHASGGPIAGLGFGTLAVCWLAVTAGAWRAAVKRDFALHRLLMRFSYAMTFGAVMLRLQMPVFFALGFPSYGAASVWLAYTSWIPNVIVVGLYAMWEALQKDVVKQNQSVSAVSAT